MRKIIALILCLTVVFSLCACSFGGNAEPENDTETTQVVTDAVTEATEKECEHVYKEEVYKKPGYGVKGANVKTCTLCGDFKMVEVPALPDVIELNVLDKTELMQGNEYVVTLEVEIKNISDKKIESVSGQITAMTSCMLVLTCDFDDLALEAYDTAMLSVSYTFDDTESENSPERKIYDADFESIKFIFEPTEVVAEE